MKKLFFTMLLAIATALSIKAQETINLVVFSEDGDAFYAFVNGIKQNNKPETNVKVTGLSPNVSIRIEFENKALPQLKRNLPFEAGMEHTLRIKKDMKQQLKLAYFGSVPLNESKADGATTVAYHTSAQADDSQSDGTTMNTNVNVNTDMNTSTTTKTTKTVTKNNNDNVAVNMNVGGMGINMNVNTTGMDMGGATTDMNTTTSTTVTTTNSSSGMPRDYSSTNTNQSNNGTVTKTRCNTPISPASFGSMKKAVEEKPFADTKMSTAKIATKNACLSVSQIKEICGLFSFEENKLEYAKYAYQYCIDKSNYYQITSVFAFSSSTDDLNKFLEQQ